MSNVEIKGIIPPILTPMNADESLNLPELRNQIERLLSGGVHGLFAFGTNGEGYILSENEKYEVLEVMIDQVKGRVPVYAGTGCISTRDTIRQSVQAEKMGADVLSIITPSFAAASQKELYDHYVTVEPNTWNGQTEEIKTVGSQQCVLVHADMDEEVAYQITKAMCENKDILKDASAALGYFDPTVAGSKALTGCELHPGAARYYEEMGYAFN